MAYLLGAALLLVVVILVVPISLGYDSTQKCFRLKWLGLTLTKITQAKQPTERSPKPVKTAKKIWKLPASAFAELLWTRWGLVWEIIAPIRRFCLEVCRTVSFWDSKVCLSLPDPMWNGLLYGVLANLHLPALNLSVNFENHNYAKIWAKVYPYRVVQNLAILLLRLPYVRLLRLAWDLKKRRRPVGIS